MLINTHHSHSNLLHHPYTGRNRYAGRKIHIGRKFYAGRKLSQWGIILAAGMLSLFHGTETDAIASENQCEADLPEAIAHITNQPQFRRARWGIRVETLGNATQPPRLVYDQEGDRLFIPASNVKLLTTAAALDQLGSTFQIRTPVYRDEDDPTAPLVSATLRLVGRGDPSLMPEHLAELAQQLSNRGIRQVSELVIDNTYFQTDAINPTWEWEDIQAGYGAAVTSMILNQNQLRVIAYPGQVGEPVRLEWVDEEVGQHWQVINQTTTVPQSGSGVTWVGRDFSQPILYVYGQRPVGASPDESAISVPDPAQFALEKFQTALEAEGIRVQSGAIAPIDSEWMPDQENTQEVASLFSPPLSELLVEANQNSENIYAEAFLRLVGVTNTSPLPASPLEAGIEEITTILAQFGIDPDSYHLQDGSGLSRRNLISPGIFVDLLQEMAYHPEAGVYRQSLAIAGETGTLKNRFRDTPVEGQFFGKTGSLSGVAALSGYLTPPNYDPLVISIIVNHSTQSGSVNRRTIDDIVLTLAQLHHCH